jgi:hypothetical protein
MVPRFEAGDGGALRVPGLYAALLQREREHREGHDAFEAQMIAEYGRFPWYPPPRRLLDELEAGLPVVVEGRELRGRSVPKVPLRREQAYAWFEVSPGDTVTPAETPEGEWSS